MQKQLLGFASLVPVEPRPRQESLRRSSQHLLTIYLRARAAPSPPPTKKTSSGVGASPPKAFASPPEAVTSPPKLESDDVEDGGATGRRRSRLRSSI